MNRLILIAGACLALGACATTAPEPIIKTVYVNVPVAVACVPEMLSGPPEYVDTDEALLTAAGPENRFSLLAAGRIQRIQRQAKTEPVLQACR